MTYASPAVTQDTGVALAESPPTSTSSRTFQEENNGFPPRLPIHSPELNSVGDDLAEHYFDDVIQVAEFFYRRQC